MNRQQHQII